MSGITQREISDRLNKNGWRWCLISSLTPGIIRIQLSDDGEEETGWRKCIESSTLEQAISDAEKFINSINAYDYGATQYPTPPPPDLPRSADQSDGGRRLGGQ